MKKRILNLLMIIFLTGMAILAGSCTPPGVTTPASNSPHTVIYNSNGAGTGTVPVDVNTYSPSAAVTVLGNTGNLANATYTFAGWNTKADGTGNGYAVGGSLTMGTADVTLYAVWTKSPCRVLYNANGAGGSVPTDGNNYVAGVTATVVSGAGTLALSGYTLAGWTTNVSGTGTSYAAGAAFTMGAADVTLYAVWLPSILKFTSTGTSITITGRASNPTGALTIPGGVTAIGYLAFFNCPNLTSISIPPSVTSIDPVAFAICFALTAISVNVANPNYETISGVLFNKTGTTLILAPGGLAGNYTIPASVTSINQNAFFDCSKLTSITVDAANQNYKSLAGVLFNKSGTMLILAPGGLAGSYPIPSSVTVVGDNAFIDCVFLTNVSIPVSVIAIGSSSFSGCNSLTIITIPAGVTAIGAQAFYGCTSLASVSVQAISAPALPKFSNAFDGCAAGLQIHVPNAAAYTGATGSAIGWRDYAAIIVTP